MVYINDSVKIMDINMCFHRYVLFSDLFKNWPSAQVNNQMLIVRIFKVSKFEDEQSACFRKYDCGIHIKVLTSLIIPLSQIFVGTFCLWTGQYQH